MSIKFYCFPKETSHPSASGFCQKLESFLRATGFTDYTLHAVQPNSAPKGKLPYIELTRDGKTETIADSHFIIRHLVENKVVLDPDINLTAVQRGESRAWQAWTEELMYPAVVYQRWGLPANFAATKAALPTCMPAIIRTLFAWYIRRSIINSLWGHGVGRHSDEERELLVHEYVEGLETRLEGTKYFHGSEPTTIDITLYSFLANSIVQPGNPEYNALVLGSERLKKYTAGLTRKWFPEYEELLEIVEKPHAD